MNITRSIRDVHANASEPEGMRALLVLYWRTLLGLVSLLMIGVFAYGGWQIFSVMNDNGNDAQPTSADTPPSSPINTAQVDAVLHGFASRQARFDARKASTTVIADPAQ